MFFHFFYVSRCSIHSGTNICIFAYVRNYHQTSYRFNVLIDLINSMRQLLIYLIYSILSEGL
jgi:hypothetical protein